MARQWVKAERSIYLTSKLCRVVEQMVHTPCTVVEAPMGYGKTTLAREAAKRLGERVIWQKVYQPDALEFWVGFQESMLQIDPACGRGLKNFGFLEHGLMGRELMHLLGELRLEHPVCLIIDDYHLVRSDNSDTFLSLFIANLPQNLRLILLTRGRLACGEELRMRGQANIIRADELIFDPQDIPGYYSLFGIRLADSQAKRLYEYSEGWVSALYLLALDFRRKGRFALTSSVSQLVEKAVYDPLEPDLKEFLLAVCLFDEFSLAEAQAVWPDGDAREMLKRLLSSNAFLSEGDVPGRFSLHYILNCCVRDHFEQLPPDRRKGIFCRVGAALVQSGRQMRALECFEQAKDWDSILRVIQDSGHACDLRQKYKELYLRCYGNCPPEKKAEYPLASLVFAMDTLTAFHEPVHSERARADFLQAMRQNTNMLETERRQLLGEYELLQSFVKFNDLFAMGAQNARAAALLPGPPRFVFTENSFTFGSPSLLCMYHREAGRLDKLDGYMKTAPGSYTKSTGGHGSGFMPLMVAEHAYYTGRWEDARIDAYHGLEMARTARQQDVELCALFLLERLALAEGNAAELNEKAEEINAISRCAARESGAYWLLYSSDLCRAWLCLMTEGEGCLPDWIASQQYPDRLFYVTVPFGDIVFGRELLARGEYARLLGLSKAFLARAGVFPNLLAAIYAYIYTAAAAFFLNRKEQAENALRRALEIASPDGLAVPFVEAAAYIVPLLDAFAREAAYTDFIRHIRVLAEGYCTSLCNIRKERRAVSAPDLTPRERQVGLLAIQGLTNVQIAKELYISPNTVKAEMKSLFAKLGVTSRALLKKENLER